MPIIYETPHEYFFRCAFPRGRMLSKIEDELTIFAQIVLSNAGKPRAEFEAGFDTAYKAIYRLSDKTIRNKRTEMTTLLGLVTETSDDLIEASPRTITLIETQDYRMFFKSFCNKFQFPNCINKSAETIKQLQHGVRFKPAQYIIKLFKAGVDRYGYDFSVSGSEVSNLIFNDLRVTTGLRTPEELFEELQRLRQQHVQWGGGSNLTQHGREFLGYMALAGLLKTDDSGNKFQLNKSEPQAVEAVANDNVYFEFPSDYVTSASRRKEIQMEWQYWFGEMTRTEINKFTTPETVYSLERIENLPETNTQGVLTAIPVETSDLSQPNLGNLLEIGNIGERVAYYFERERVKKIRPDQLSLVRIVSNDRSLGYDILSLDLEDVTRKKYIEVKTTKRTYAPSSQVITDFPMSINEWNSAKQFQDIYYIYRVFLTTDSVKISIIRNPAEKNAQGLIILEPSHYNVLVKLGAIDESHDNVTVPKQ